MQIVYKKVNDLIPYENNPRINDEAVEYVKNSIKEFGFKVPIIIDKNNIIIAGHTRLKASQELNLEEVPCIIANDLSGEQIKAFRLADNKVAEKSMWDYSKLDEELDSILNIDMSLFDFSEELEENDLTNEENPYTTKVKIPQYEMKGEMPELFQLVDEKKQKELEDKIINSNLSEKEKDFLIKASYRHYVFDYSKIAEYYSHANKEMQKLMEDSALVIIDLNDAIANGYCELSEKLEEMIDEE